MKYFNFGKLSQVIVRTHHRTIEVPHFHPRLLDL